MSFYIILRCPIADPWHPITFTRHRGGKHYNVWLCPWGNSIHIRRYLFHQVAISTRRLTIPKGSGQSSFGGGLQHTSNFAFPSLGLLYDGTQREKRLRHQIQSRHLWPVQRGPTASLGPGTTVFSESVQASWTTLYYSRIFSGITLYDC